MDSRSPCKKLIMQGFLAAGYVHTLVNPQFSSVRLPARFREDRVVCLKYGDGDGIDTPSMDLRLCDEGVTATLLFHGEPFETYVPWSAVWLIGTPGHNDVVWPEDCPPDLHQDLPLAAQRAARRERPAWLTVI